MRSVVWHMCPYLPKCTSWSVDFKPSDCRLDKPCKASVFVKKVQVGKDQEKALSERDSHSKNRGGKKPN